MSSPRPRLPRFFPQALAALLMTAAAGCTAPEPEQLKPQVPRVLYNFDSCDDLLEYAKTHAKESLDEFGTIYGQGSGWGGGWNQWDDFNNEGGDGEPAGDSGTGGTDGESGGGGTPGVDYSETNVQELGIDEPDLVKTDGERIVVLAGNNLHLIDATGTPQLTGSLELKDGSWNPEMFLYEDRILIFERIHVYDYQWWGGGGWGGDGDGGGEPGWEGESGDGESGDGEWPDEEPYEPYEPEEPSFPDAVKQWYSGTSMTFTRITEVDISDMSAPKVVSHLYVSGDYVSARRIDGTSRVVLNSQPMGLDLKSPWDFLNNDLPYPENQEEWDALMESLVAQAKEHNAAEIDASTVEQWIPHYVFEDVAGGGQISEGLLSECVDTMYPGIYSGLTTTSVLTIDLEEKGLTPEGSVGLFAEGAIVYASSENLYVATRSWLGFDAWEFLNEPGIFDGDWGEDEPGGSVSTSASPGGDPLAGSLPPDSDLQFRDGEDEAGITSYVHKFAIPAGEKAIYRASGELRGRLLNQWSMNEHRGDLRVATTDQQSWDASTWESFVTVLREDDGTLSQIGQVGELGKGEEIKSVRYVGDIGYVVTFLQIDPLYTIDLSDHENPKVAGELKINGFSAYLHPLGPDHLIGVGFDGTPEGQLLGVQVSLFDVSNIYAPTRTHQASLGDFGWTEVAFDHKAFLHWEPTSTTVFPVESDSWDEEGNYEWFSGAAAYTIDPEAGISPQGTITHQVNLEDPWYGSPSLRRSLVIGDLLYTVSGSGLKASALADLSDQAWVEW